MTALFVLTLVLCKIIFFGKTVDFISKESISFGAAVELAVAMPLSWLPLISDYTREAAKPFQATLISTITYGLTSSWMYAIGLGAAIFTGEYDIAQIMVKAGLGIAGLVIIIFATVTTTFMDAFSAGVSAESIYKKLNSKWVAILITIIGTVGAMIYPMDDITNFLYLIGSVFAPMAAILITDYFILKKDDTDKNTNLINLVIWVIGFIIYRKLMQVDTIIGNTLPDMLITIVICIVIHYIIKTVKRTNYR
jgi:putative hydroxymethylpyrimidine transporter CytX